VHPFTASPETPVLGVQTKVSYPPKLLLIVTTSEGSPEHEVTMSVDNSNAGLGVISTFTSTNSELQLEVAKNTVFGRAVLVDVPPLPLTLPVKVNNNSAADLLSP